MRKIPTLFIRDATDRSRVTTEVTPGCEWVLAGEGIATRKLDGTCCLVQGGALYKRRELRVEDQEPDGWLYADHDDTTGKRVGWVPVRTDRPEDRYHIEGFALLCNTTPGGQGDVPDGTYELVGPKVQGNPDAYDRHTLVRHGIDCGLPDVPVKSMGEIATEIQITGWEGFVWHHPDGRMAKLKGKDIGINTGIKGPRRG